MTLTLEPLMERQQGPETSCVADLLALLCVSAAQCCFPEPPKGAVVSSSLLSLASYRSVDRCVYFEVLTESVRY